MIGVSFGGYNGRKKETMAQSVSDVMRIMSAEEEAEKRQRGKKRPAVATPFFPLAKKRAAERRQQEEYDPVDGPVVGKANNMDVEPDGQQRSVGAKGGFRISVSRTEMTKSRSLEMDCDVVTFVKLEYDLIFSQKGYLKGRSTERKVWEQSFFVKADGEGKGSGTCCVRAFWDNDKTDKPTLTKLAFGDEASLGTYDLSKDDFAANYEDGIIGGVKKAIPPVKRVAVSACTNGIKD